ncbi:kinesin light chain 3 [Curvularia clavata]|uniref:Kinesin light chain 3 n=1 Tax=Curvularia clavata TaxID=95742 RepID=A0A9Q8ZD25_CURCL|nr:kinesin light chain 3 [Curvularia clavata]
MWLLHFDTLDKLILTDFRGKPIPPYAILSHRWGDSEILIEDISNRNYEEKEEGCQKLRFCAEQAAQDGLQYFWIDTCCIDRWDNNERSKAINSMFQWYRNAARCYVFLLDVSLSATADTPQHSDWETSFRKSEWFTRGWTLQELVAPVSVEFFSREGERIGDKASLDRLLHDITKIPLAALRNCSLDQFSISERIRWAENRRTTEEEDIVYCLLGVLGVAMPTTYGEGKESALRRLQAEVEEIGSAPSIIPFSRNQSFVGRELHLAELEAKLFSNKQTTTTLAIVGPSGTGKSQLALEAAFRTKQNSRSCSVFWMDASDRNSLYRSYTNVAQKLSIPGCDDDQADIKQVVERCVATISTRQCLLVLDNVECATIRPSGLPTTEATSADLTKFLPHSKSCSVIFTTTESNIAEALAPQNVVALHELTADTALRMLQSRLAAPFSNTEQQIAMHLLRELLYLPLAIAQAAACMNASSMTVQQYQAQLDQHKDAALSCSGELTEGKQQECVLRKTIAATLSLSISQAYNNDTVTVDYLFIAACVDRKDISLDILEAASPRTREDAIKVLDKYALVTRRPAESALDIHRLVHDALRTRLQAQGQLQQWTQRAIVKLVEVFPNDDHNNRSKWRRLLPHALFTLSHIQTKDSNKERLDLAGKCATSLYNDGRYKEAEELQVQVMQTKKRVLGEEHPDTLDSTAKLAMTYRGQGRWGEAEELQVKVMQTQKRVLGEEHPDTLNGMGNLASTYWNQGRWKEAEELEVQVMQTQKRVLGEEHPDTLISIGNLATTYSYQGRWKEAEELEVQVAQARKSVLGDEHPYTLASMVNLASTYWKQGRWGEAEELQVQVMQIQKRVLGEEHLNTLNSMGNLASTYRNQGRWKEAEELQMKVMQTHQSVLGEEHPDTLNSMGNLASTYSYQGRWKEAEELEVQVVQAEKRVLGEEHPDTLISVANLASTYRDQGRWGEAEELQVKVMQTQKRVLGEEHPSTLNNMGNLASTYSNQGRWKEAEELEIQVIETSLRVLGKEHLDTLNTMGNLASTYRDQGRWKEAEELQVQVMQTKKRVLGEEHSNTLNSMANLVSTYRGQGRWKEAEELELQVMQTQTRVLGEGHPHTLISMNNLAFTLQSQARREEALALMETCFQLRREVFGEKHHDTQSSLNTLNTWRAEYRDENL